MDDHELPTLQSLSIKGVLILLWSRDDTKRLIESKLGPIFNENIKEWEKVEDKVKQDILCLLPKKIANEFGEHLRPIGLELLAWIEFHFMHVKLKPKIPDKISWTSKGSIDLVKTAEILIKDESLDLYDRYKLACAFCLEAPIRELWEKIDQNDIRYYDYGLVLYWSLWNQKRVPKEYDEGRIRLYESLNTDIGGMENLEGWGLRCALESANFTATKYFFGKLKEKEIKKIFYAIDGLLPYRTEYYQDRWTKGYFLKKYCFDVFLFACTDLSGKQKKSYTDFSVLPEQPGSPGNCLVKTSRSRFPNTESVEDYLTGYLDWSFQEVLLEIDTAILSSNTLPPSSYEINTEIFFMVFREIINGDHDGNQLFYKFWGYRLDPSQREYICNCFIRVWMKVDFKRFVQAHGISLNFEGWSPFDMDLASIGRYRDSSKFYLFEIYVLACLCPREIMIGLKQDHKKRILDTYYLNDLRFDRMDARTLKWYEFFEYLDQFIGHDEAKRLRTYPSKRNKFRIIFNSISSAASNIPALFNKMKIRK